jgi:oligopeptide/dipeptide ABC transporter ATP-binding protein
MMQALPALISVRAARKYFPVRRGLFARGPAPAVHAVDDIDLDLLAGETLALVGESGSGKTTLSSLVLGLTQLTAGEILWEGKRVGDIAAGDRGRFRRDVQVVFQNPYGTLNPRMSIGRIVARPLKLHRIVPYREIEREVLRLIDMVGLQPAASFVDRFPHELSGGQRQRVAIARALATRPRIIVADEPVSALDVSVRAQILNLLRDIRRQLQLTMLFTTHDLGVVRYVADRVAVMYLGKIVELASRKAFFARPFHPYSQLLLGSALSPDPTVGGLAARAVQSIGEPPSPLSPPSGCRFRTRCLHAFARCAAEEPRLREVGPGQHAACHLNETQGKRS